MKDIVQFLSCFYSKFHALKGNGYEFQKFKKNIYIRELNDSERNRHL